MVEVRISDQTLELASELWCFEQDYISSVCNLLKVMLVNARILPEISSNRYIDFHFAQWSGRRDYLQEIRSVIIRILLLNYVIIVFRTIVFNVIEIYLNICRQFHSMGVRLYRLLPVISILGRKRLKKELSEHSCEYNFELASLLQRNSLQND